MESDLSINVPRSIDIILFSNRRLYNEMRALESTVRIKMDARGILTGNLADHLVEKVLSFLDNRNITFLNLENENIDSQGIGALVNVLNGSQIKCLNLANNRIGLEGFIKIAELLEVTEIETLILRNTNLFDLAVTILADALIKSGIQSLDLSHNQITWEGVVELATHLGQTVITSLDLSYNAIGFVGTEAIAGVLKETEIESLNLTGTGMTASGVKAIANVLKESPQMTSLNIGGSFVGCAENETIALLFNDNEIVNLGLTNNVLDKRGIHLISQNLKYSKVGSLDLGFNGLTPMKLNILTTVLNDPRCKITSLNLQGNLIQDSGAKFIATVLKYSQITNLNVASSVIRKHGAIELANALAASKIVSLDISNNHIPLGGITPILKVLKYSQIKILNLSNNHIRNRNSKGIMNYFKDTKITHLNLGGNHLETNLAVELVQVLPNSEIVCLNLSNNLIGPRGAYAIAHVLTHTRIIYLDLEGNRIGDRGVMSFAAVLQNTRLINLNIARNSVTDEGGQSIAHSLKETIFTVVNLENNAMSQETLQIIRSVLFDNQLKIDRVYHLFVNLLQEDDGVYKFIVTDEDKLTLQYIKLTELISISKQNPIDHFLSRGNMTRWKEQMEYVIENVEIRLAELFSTSNHSCIDRVILLLLCEEHGLSLTVDKLLDQRFNYLLIQTGETRHPLYGFLHPSACILMHKYGKPYYSQDVGPTRTDLLWLCESTEWDDLIREYELGRFLQFYSKAKLLEILLHC